MRTKLKTDRGVAGLSILLALITMLFVIGLLIMIFALMGTELRDATYTSTSGTVTNETGAWINTTVYTVDGAGTRNEGTYVLTAIWNLSESGNYNVSIPTGNATLTTGGNLTNATAVYSGYENVSITYTYVYDADNTATNVMNDTTVGISAVTEWYPIFIVIGAMVVLILLTVIIITAIRGSGMMVGEGSA